MGIQKSAITQLLGFITQEFFDLYLHFLGSKTRLNGLEVANSHRE